MGLAALAAMGTNFVLACQPAASAVDVAELRAEVDKLKKRINAQDGERPSAAEQAAYLKARGEAFEKRIAGEKPEQPRATEEQRLLQLALTAADTDIKYAHPPGGQIVEPFKCSETLCRAQTTHVSRQAYDAFVRAAFSGVPAPMDSKDPDRPAIYPGWFSITQAGATGDKFGAVLYVGRVDKAKPSRAKVPQ